MEKLGYEVEIDEAVLSTYQRFAGTDETRLAAIHRAAASGADIALITRGGYGITRLLPKINYSAIANAVESGTKFVGFSDFTAFQMAVMAKTGATTWAGPALGEDFGAKAGPDDIMESCFYDLITGQGEGTGWRVPKIKVKSKTDNELTGYDKHYSINDATLWGGNLAMLSSLVGTDYFPDIKNGILFIEDTGEHPYRIERMLAQLLEAGILNKQKAIIFGQFNNYTLTPHDGGYTLMSVVNWLQCHVNAQILTGLPFGHVATKVLLPFGQKVTLTVEERDAFLLWGHQH